MTAVGRLRGLIFDMDGTLADTEEVHRRAFNAAFEEFGLPIRWDPAEHRRRLPAGAGRQRLTALFAEEPLASKYRGADAERMVVAVHERKTEFFTAEIEAGRAELRPGVRRLLEEAVRADVKIAVASTAHVKSVHAVLRVNLGEALYRRFVSIYAGNDIPNKKPHPEVYLRCLADMALPAGAVVALEDTRIGMLSALAAELTTVVTYTHWTDDQDFAGAALVVDNLGEPGGPAVQVRKGPVPAAGYVGLENLAALLGERGA